MDPDTTPSLRMTVLASADNIAIVRHGLAGFAEALGAMPDLVDDIKTAVSEAVTNAVVHGYADSAGPVDVLAKVTGRNLEIVVRDYGAGIQPRPLTDEDTSLRVGLALVGALSDEFVVRGEEGQGTEVRMTFDLDRAERGEVEQHDMPSADVAPTETETRLSIRGAEAGDGVLPKVLTLMVARADLDLERLSDAQMIADFLARWSSTVDSRPLDISVLEAAGAIQIKVGPLEPGLGEQMLASNEVPGLGNTLERITHRAEVAEVPTGAGPAEYLVLELRSD
ncbi:MAG: serine/threonine-protein kinase RsbW [Pseudonocardiales bacterium]|nr:serine/threonine-protein kinase RsbW [Pseudonocardiales bacterium]